MHNTTRRQMLGALGLAGAAFTARGLGGCSDAASRVDAGGFDASAPDSGGPDGATADDDAGGLCLPTRPDAQGPFFVAGAPNRTMLASVDEPGERLSVIGTVVADDCRTPVEGALLDVWQADASGAYHDAGNEYRLRGQLLTDAAGAYGFTTIKPGNYQTAPGAWRPAHIHFTVSKPGHLPVTTQLYFAGDPYLPPNDGCAGCGSDDPERVIVLHPGAGGVLRGEFRIVLRRA